MKMILPTHEVIVTPGQEVQVNIDRLRMEQVFSNLSGYAAKYSQKYSRIHISALVDESNFVTLLFADERIDMSDSSLESIFDKFYRSEGVLKTYPGLGMGLYITSKIISDHGGRMWANSEEGIGSTFFLLFRKLFNNGSLA